MRRLGRPLLRLLGRDDRGAIGVLIAVLIGGGVLLGMAALVIDVGQIYQNRAELQNGADAAALAIAYQCSQGNCPASPMTTATTYAKGNASALTQGFAGVDCIHGSDGLSSSCPLNVIGGGGLTDCPHDPTSSSTHFVDVQTETLLKNGSTLLPPVFGRAIVGNSTYNGTTVKACAQAEWGPPGTADTVAFTISGCEWATATGGTANPPTPGPTYWDMKNGLPDPSVSADVAYDQSLTFHSGNSVTSGQCPEEPAFADAPGAFGWTSDPNGNCQTAVLNNTYGPKTGDSMDGGCQTALTNAYNNKQAVLVPVYTTVAKQGANTVYTLWGFASFVITGFHAPGITEPDWLNPGLLCVPPNVKDNSHTCIDGFFTTNALCTTDCNTGGNPLGTQLVKLTG